MWAVSENGFNPHVIKGQYPIELALAHDFQV